MHALKIADFKYRHGNRQNPARTHTECESLASSWQAIAAS